MLKKCLSKLKALPEYLLYLLIFLLPWTTRYIFHPGSLNGDYWEYGTYAIYLIDLIWLIWLGSCFIGQLGPANGRLKEKLNIRLALLLVALVAFFSFYWARDKELAGYYFSHLAMGLLSVYLISRLKINYRKIAAAISGAGLIQALLAIGQFASQKVAANKWLGMAEQLPENPGVQVISGSFGRVLKAYGAFPHPNILALFLVVAMLATIYLYLTWRPKKWPCLLLINYLLLNCGLILTFSRQGWLLLSFSLLLWLILVRPRQESVKFIAISLLLVIVFSLIYQPLLLARFSLNERIETISLTDRYEQYQQAGQLLKLSWLEGLGLGNYTLAVHDVIDKNLASYEYQPVHNIYLLILIELGTGGLIAFLLLIGQAIYLWLSRLNRHLEITEIWLGISWLGLLLIAFFDHYWWTIYPYPLIFWLILGLLLQKREKALD